jgi:hypothetical protein
MPPKSLKEALAYDAPRQPKAPRPLDKALQEAVARESTARYRQLVSELNRSSDSDIERALQRA